MSTRPTLENILKEVLYTKGKWTEMEVQIFRKKDKDKYVCKVFCVFTLKAAKIKCTVFICRSKVKNSCMNCKEVNELKSL